MEAARWLCAMPNTSENIFFSIRFSLSDETKQVSALHVANR
jgi:hypothetical protein